MIIFRQILYTQYQLFALSNVIMLYILGMVSYNMEV